MKRAAISISLLVFAVGLEPAALAQSPGAATKDKSASGMSMPMDQGIQGATHKGTGTVKQVDAKQGKLTLAHEPIPSMSWPAMTMQFDVADRKLLEGLQPGAKVHFAFSEKTRGRYVISDVNR